MDAKTQADTIKRPGIALVTGAAKRVGRHIALALAQHGWDVAVHYSRSQSEAEETVTAITAMGRRALALRADLTVEAEVLGLLAACASELGEVSCVVNNASLFEYDQAQTLTYANLEAHTRVNLGAPVLLARELYRRRADSAVGELAAVVINVLDQKLYNLNADFFSYTLTKAGLQAATMMLAMELAPKVRVVGVAPGLTMISAYQNTANFAAGQKRLPLARATAPEDIGGAVCYLAGAAAVTGTILLVDGGEHLVAASRDVMFMPS